MRSPARRWYARSTAASGIDAAMAVGTAIAATIHTVVSLVSATLLASRRSASAADRSAIAAS